MCLCEKGERETETERERERVCNVLQHQLGMANITSTAIRLMLPSISLMEMCSAYKAAKHFSSGNAFSIHYKAAKHFSSGYALSLTKLPSISIVEMRSAYYKAAKHFIIGLAAFYAWARAKHFGCHSVCHNGNSL